MYTTKLDKSRAKISEREATMIAAEIEGKKTTNLHLAEERRQIDYREAVCLPLLHAALHPSGSIKASQVLWKVF